MGLGPDQKMRRAAAWLQGGGWLLPLAIIALSCVIELGGDSGRLLLRYERPDITQGEVWRLLTGHFVHLGTSHLVMNLLALLGIWLIVGRNFEVREWLVAGAIVIGGIDAGFWWLDSQLIWYVGLSGVLHGLLVAGLAAGWRVRPAESAVLAGLLVAKLAFEQWYGALPGSAATAGGAVVVNAHLYGALAGLLAWLGVQVRAAATPSE